MGMTAALVLVSAAYGAFLMRTWSYISTPVKGPVIPMNIWAKLPSGWTRTVSESITIYAMTVDGCAYWWVERNGRTVIEGPSSSLDMAKIEAEREAYELTRP